MPETATAQRAWRLDRMGPSPGASQTDENHAAARPAEGEAVVTASPVATAAKLRTTTWQASVSHSVRDWLGARLGFLRRDRSAFEEVIHEFAAMIDHADDPDTVEEHLLLFVRRMAPSSRIELVPEAEADHRDAVGTIADAASTGTAHESRPRFLEIRLRCGASICGRLRIRPRAGAASSYSKEDIRRLTTIATIATCAMEGLGLFTEWPQVADCHDERVNSPSADHPTDKSHQPGIQLQDATFLNAVLPFALSQARRHREPLSIACVAIDRLSAIKQLLGKAEADRLVRHVAQVVGGLIRSSDIVARLDDDRVIAVLPRAPRRGAMHVAENICAAIKANSPRDCETPSLTVSIGVATFPSCADNVYSLFDAADEALAWAQKNGRSQAVLAHPRPLAETGHGQSAVKQ
jgi:diguanylate cyclase (GGDEF)-like protein